jgi:hypothetical protein
MPIVGSACIKGVPPLALPKISNSVGGSGNPLPRPYNSVAIEGIADIRRSLAARRSDAYDPLQTSAAQANG